MKMTTTKRIIIVWLLSVILMIPHVVKSVHGFEECHSGSYSYSSGNTDKKETQNNHHEHNCDDCTICRFVVPFFTETEQSPYISVIRELNIIISPACREELYISYVSTYNLRAPPSLNSD